MNYFVEGQQGAGKSTLVQSLYENLENYEVFREGDYCPVELAWCTYTTKAQYDEILEKYADIKEDIIKGTTIEKGPDGDRYVITYTKILTDIPGFHKDLERYEIYNNNLNSKEFEKVIMTRLSQWNGANQIFECAIFQNIIENMMLFFDASDEEITLFYKRIGKVLEGKDYKILYLEVKDVEQAIQVIKKERSDENGNELWFPMMINYLEESPRGKKEGLKGLEGLVAHLERRAKLEKKILEEVFKEHAVILPSKEYTLGQIINK